MQHEKLLELARRRLGIREAPRALDLLRDPGAGAAVLEATGLPPVWAEGVRSFYEMLAPGPRVCIGTACRLARGELAAPAPMPAASARCLGRCHESPAEQGRAPLPIPRRALTSTPVVLRHLLGQGEGDPWSDYDLPAGPAILEAIESWGLRGRGGAAYPTAAKWKAARDTPADDRFVVANGDEGDPGAYVDRLLLEEAPHSVLAGMVACARAVGAGRGVVYIRAEYPAAAEAMRTAIEAARRRGVLGDFEVGVLVGAGSYVAGEETALLRSIEGLRAEPSPKPPYPAVRGLHGLPTVVQNVETLSMVPFVARRRAGTPRTDTKAVCVSGVVARPGVVEVDLGTPLRRVLEEGAGGESPGRTWKMALVGGPLGRVVPASAFDVPLSFDALPGLGHAGLVVFDEGTSARALAEHLFEFARAESCGNCAPCRLGTAQLASRRSRTSFERLLATIGEGSLCGFGQSVPRPLRDLLGAFGDEVLR
jgi:NADH:ubiquinone oxidoreductase subunit F (NADH-binding)